MEFLWDWLKQAGSRGRENREIEEGRPVSQLKYHSIERNVPVPSLSFPDISPSPASMENLALSMPQIGRFAE